MLKARFGQRVLLAKTACALCAFAHALGGALLEDLRIELAMRAI